MGRRTAPLSRVVAVAIGATVAVAMLIGGLLTDRVVRAEQYGAVDDFLVASTDRPLPPPDDERPTEIPEGDEGVIRAFTSRVTDDIAIRIVSDDGELLTPTDGVQLPDPPADSTDGELRTVTVDGDRYRVITTTTEWGAEVQIGRNLDEADTTVASIRRWLLAAGVVATAIAFGIGWWWSRRIARPIVRLAETADGVAERGEIDRRSATLPDGPTIAEVERLRSSFTSMLDALAASSDRQRRLVADASHELRTPLTVLRTNAELAASDRLTPDHRRRALGLIVAEVDELSDLTDELVELASDHRRAESEAVVDAVAVVEAVADRATARTGRTVEVTAPEPVRWRCQPGRIDRAVWNLVDNALKFSPDATPIEIRLVGDRVEVLDSGMGIGTDELEQVFERFHRSDEARGMRGSGLGLSIVAQVATDHGGTADAARRQDGPGVVVGFTVAADRVS
ncbi:two-component system sensor histidine kinase MprB [Ilumatobacter fluminis]|uniref:histidine kinase n=1 Tax=Ilumatobacter fluminis TaxID=467091 RepID=A0A4R7I3D6_9ACTN|nr:HAMP domain-containing sensor histidine kinase [Ilumatobacter fluminis]TDT18091.1 two-component system sensor histidine kinase MprB [Ilumatobacter fluminis]